MLEYIVLLFLTFAVLKIIYRKITSSTEIQCTVPGPKPWPVIGNLAQLDIKGPQKTLLAWGLKFGHIYKIYFGPDLVIVLNTIEAAKEAFVKQGDVFSGRPRNFIMDQILKGERGGIGNMDGPVWKQQRRLAIQILRNFGLGKSVMESKIYEEIEKMFSEVDSQIASGQCDVDIVLPLKFATGNIIVNILLGRRFEHGDPDFNRYQACISENIRIFGKAQIVNYFPLLRFIVPGGCGFWKMMENLEVTQNFLRTEIAKHYDDIKAGKVSEIPSDFCHAYLKEMERIHEAGEPDAYMFTLDQLLGVVGDIFVAGHETTVTTLSWAFAYLITYPDVCERCCREILKLGRLANFEDRKEMNFVQAFLLETQRCGNIIPFGLPHSTMESCELFNYKIPKNATVLLNLGSIFSDPKYFPEPQRFNPERFLDSDGQLKSSEAMIPFSLGKRVCLGESLAKMELFLMLSWLLFRYRISCADDGLPSLDPRFGITLTPQPYKVKFEKRLPYVTLL